MKLTDTADAFPRCRFCISPPVHSLAPLRSLTNALVALTDISFSSLLRLVIIRSPNIWKCVIHLSYRNLLITFLIRNPAIASASFSLRNPSFADACRPKSAWAPDTSHKVEQVPPCIYTGRNLLGI